MKLNLNAKDQVLEANCSYKPMVSKLIESSSEKCLVIQLTEDSQNTKMFKYISKDHNKDNIDVILKKKKNTAESM